MDWTNDQLEAINYREGSAIVSAAAGSGKTAVLVERVKRMMMDKENPVSADEIVLVTFTQKAAAELKIRLDKALAAAEAENGGDEYLRQQRIKLEDANISTISAFCMRLLREYSSVIDLSPDFGVLDESESDVIITRVISDILEEFYKSGDAEKKQLLYDWYGSENDKALEKSVRYIFDFMRKLPDAEKSLGEWMAVYKNPDKNYEATRKIVLERYLRPAADEIKLIFPSVEIGEDEALNNYSEAMSDIADLAERCADGKEDAMDEIAVSDVPNIDLRKVKAKLSDEEKEAVKKSRDKIRKLLAAFKEMVVMLGSLKEHYEQAAPVFEALVELAVRTDEEYTARKRLKNKIDFSDGELLAVKLLSDENAAKAIRSSISDIIVDEFQDSNDLQYDIFCRLSKNKTNLFFVGDIKQSIYHFRGANPRVFNRVIEEAHQENSVFRHITLNRNFRSSDKVINAVNNIFEGTMTKQVGEVEYNDEHKLIQGAKYMSDKTDIAELIRFSGSAVGDLRKTEADYIARRIKQMVSEGFEVSVSETKKRPCRYGDFAVLMGKYKSNAFIYKKAFDEYNVPYVAKEDGVFTDYYEIKLILSLLKIVDNPYRNVDMAAVLMLPPYNFTAEELCEIRLCGKGEKDYPHKYLYTGLIQYSKTSSKAAAFLDELNALREFSTEHSPEQLVRKIYDESDVMAVILAMFDGEKRGANVRRLISYAKKYSENGLKGLSDFISYMDNLTRSDINTAQAESAEMTGDSVQIMTIHGSKGLEFPVCFISNLTSVTDSKVTNSLTTRKMINFGYAGKIVADIDLGIGFQIVDRKNNLISDTFPFVCISDDIRAQEASEEMRLLYVALTRAKEKLIITCPMKNRAALGGHLKWICESKAATARIVNADGTCENVLNIIDNPVCPASADNEAEDESAADKLVIRLSPQYRYSVVNEYRAKVTATQIGVKSVDDFAKTSDHIDRFIKSPGFLKGDEEKALSGKKRGDAYHKIMELIDFSGDVSQLDELYAKGLITSAEKTCVDPEEIEKFLQSDLCRRITCAGRIEKEFPIFFQYTPEGFPEDEEKPFVQGIADLFFVENGEIVLVDYKTNRGVTEADLIEEYTGQLRIYSEALEEVTAMKVKACYLYSFTLGKEIKIEA